MNKKKIISGLLALTFVLGGTALPNTVVNNSVSASAAASETEVLTYGDYEYTLLEDGTVEITFYSGSDTDIEIPAEINGAAVTSIGMKAFEMCYDIKSIVIPDGVKTIGGGAFSMCSYIESIVIPDSVEYIGRDAFWYCSSLKSITLPEGLKQICDHTFMLTSLENVVIPDSVESIGRGAFCFCNFKSIELPKGLKKIDASAFANCQNLESITLPEGLEEIEAFAFGNCSGLKSITIPASVTKIGDDAFSETYYTDDSEDVFYKSLEDVTINCYANSAAEKYAIANGLNYKLIDEKLPNCPPPKKMVIKAECSSEYHQIRLRWKPYENAEKYGIAVYLAGKWRVWTCSIPADVTVFTSPKNLTPGTEYKIAVAARVNGNWNVRDAIYDAVKVTVK